MTRMGCGSQTACRFPGHSADRNFGSSRRIDAGCSHAEEGCAPPVTEPRDLSPWRVTDNSEPRPARHLGEAIGASRKRLALIMSATAILTAVASFVVAAEPAPAGVGSEDGAAASAASPADWWSTVQRRIAEEEYRVTRQGRTYLADIESAWHAPNRAHGFRTYFTDGGIRVIPRTEEDPSWEWGLELVGYGRGDTVWPVAEARLIPADNRINFDRGGVVEWYVNDPQGLHQGFTLFERPEDQAAGPAAMTVGPSGTSTARLPEEERGRAVYVELALTGTLNPAFSIDGLVISSEVSLGSGAMPAGGSSWLRCRARQGATARRVTRSGPCCGPSG
jgi:hypothetical protein